MGPSVYSIFLRPAKVLTKPSFATLIFGNFAFCVSYSGGLMGKVSRDAVALHSEFAMAQNGKC